MPKGIIDMQMPKAKLDANYYSPKDPLTPQSRCSFPFQSGSRIMVYMKHLPLEELPKLTSGVSLSIEHRCLTHAYAVDWMA